MQTEESRESAARLARYEWMLADPETARHLLLLLSQGKGDRDAFERMIDRIQTSKEQASEHRI